MLRWDLCCAAGDGPGMPLFPLARAAHKEGGAAALAWISHTIFARSPNFAERLIAFLGARRLVASGDARGTGTFAGCGGSEDVVSVGLWMMPRLLRVAAARIRQGSRARLRRRRDGRQRS